MSSTAQNRGPIRLAFQSRLKAVLTTAGVVVPGTAKLAALWNGLPLDIPALQKAAKDNSVPGRYVRLAMGWGPDLVIEMGPTPRVEGGGHAEFGIFTETGTGHQVNDALCKIVADGFPLYADLVRDGLNVRIDTSSAGEIVAVNGWDYCPLQVNWNVWRV